MEGINRTLAESERDSAYEYLCRLEEAKRWVEEMIKEIVPPLEEFEDRLANGVYLCKLGMALLPDNPQWKKVYDLDQSKYSAKGLHFRHTDNLHFFIDCLPKLGLSKVFYPSVDDIYERRNMFKLIYCLHALSHLLCKQGKTKKAVTEYNVSPTINDDVLKKATLTLRESNVSSFETVESLVEEELQYAQIGIMAHETTEDDESRSSTLIPPSIIRISNGSRGNSVDDEKKPVTSTEGSDEDSINSSTDLTMFDDPKYVRVSSDGTILPNEDDTVESNNKATPTTGLFQMEPILKDVKCQGAGITVTLYSGSSLNMNGSYGSTQELSEALSRINQCIVSEGSKQTLKALQNPSANLPFPYLEASDYFEALVFEKTNGIPANVIAVYRGLQRSLCDTILEKLRPGAYLLRQSTTLGNGEFVFSFRNQVGIKHWKLSINKNGKLSFNGAQNLFDSLESFLKYFVEILSKVTKLFVYPGMAFMLNFNISSLTPDQTVILEDIRKSYSNISYGQIAYIISDVNSRIRKERAISREIQPITVSQINKSKTVPNAYSRSTSSRSLHEGLNVTANDTKWDTSMILSISRREADELLEHDGYPGAFLVRPSENAPNSYALAFRIHNDTRRWRIVKSNGKFFVHPRPNPYNTLSDIITHFRDAVGAETGLIMTPLLSKQLPERPKSFITNKMGGSPSQLRKMLQGNQIPPIPARRGRHSTGTRPYGKGPLTPTESAKPSPSMSRLNPGNVTSWSVDDVCQWLLTNGLDKFMEVFRDNCVDGECLLTLDKNMLKEDLKITQLGYRSKIMNRIEVLRNSQYVPYS